MLLFALLFVVNDPFASFGARGRSPVVRHELERRYGLDRPIPVQYARWVAGVATGELGVSMVHPTERVADIIAQKTANSARLAAAAFVIELCVGTGAAVLSAATPNRFWDRSVTVASVLALGMPIVVICLAVQHQFALTWHVLPLSGASQGGPLGFDDHVVLPAICLAVTDAAVVARILRAALAEAANRFHVSAARARGLSEKRILTHHVLRVALPAALPYLGLVVGTLFTGTVIVENVFGYDGLGRAIVTAILTNDNPVVLGLTVVSVVVFVVGAAATDVVQAWLDPRVRIHR